MADVAGRLVEVIDNAPGDVLPALADRLDAVVTALAAAAEGSADDYLADAVVAFTRARDAALDAAQAVAAAIDHVTDYLRALGFPTASPTPAASARVSTGIQAFYRVDHDEDPIIVRTPATGWPARPGTDRTGDKPGTADRQRRNAARVRTNDSGSSRQG